MEATPPSIPPVTGGGLGHPGHFAGQGNPVDIAAIGDSLVAVGFTFPEIRAVAWSSADRQHWALGPLPPAADGGFALSIAAGTTGPAVGRAAIVGRIGNDAAAWTSTDGATWQPARGDGLVEAPGIRMTAVAATDRFVAGGWAGIVTQPGVARFWRSADGRAWQPAPIDAGPNGVDGRVASVAAGPGGFVAVGATGAVGHATGSAVWRSRDGRRWERVASDAALAAGGMVSVAAGGPGYVAVGADLAGTHAMVWLSPDGRTWTTAPAQESLEYHGLGITMSDVVAGADGTLVAVGHFLFGQQYGQGSAWTSPDGRTWTRMPDQASLGQAEPLAVIPDGPGYVAAGTVGAPDNFIPTIWLSPAR